MPAIDALKRQPGRTVGVHGVDLIESLLVAGQLDELRFILCPVIAGRGRRLLDGHDVKLQLDLQSARTTPTGLQYLIYTPRPSGSP